MGAIPKRAWFQRSKDWTGASWVFAFYAARSVRTARLTGLRRGFGAVARAWSQRTQRWGHYDMTCAEMSGAAAKKTRRHGDNGPCPKGPARILLLPDLRDVVGPKNGY